MCVEDYEVDTLRIAPPVLAWLVEYETVSGWEGEGESRHRTWTPVRLTTTEWHEVQAVAENPMYCRNKRVTPLVAGAAISSAVPPEGGK